VFLARLALAGNTATLQKLVDSELAERVNEFGVGVGLMGGVSGAGGHIKS
jgi:hypothetical protein